jgi:predicted nucleic acid-binding Zn ribbon protein
VGRPALSTTQRGLGHAHQADKRRLLAEFRPGDPCLQRFRDGTVCGKPMFPWQELDRGHIIDRALGGVNGPAILVHASCNRKAGAQLGILLRSPGMPPSRSGGGPVKPCATCGKVTDRRARRCEVCGTHCHPSHSFVRTCSRKCGAQLRLRRYGYAGYKPPRPQTPCALCGEPCPADARFCSKSCADQGMRRSWPASSVTFYTCRYCGGVYSAHGPGAQKREVCPGRACQLARLMANNLRTRKGLSKKQADAQMAVLVKAATPSREW